MKSRFVTVCFGAPTGDKTFTVEHFEQTLETVTVRGIAYRGDGSPYAHWTSIAVSIDAAAGTLTYTYNCDVYARTSSFQGVAVFPFERETPRDAPTTIDGYSADLVERRAILQLRWRGASPRYLAVLWTFYPNR
jgi:hypothetical protein